MVDLSLIHSSPFYELATLLALAAFVGFIGLSLRQPMVVGFIAVGVLAGPSVLDLVHSHESIELLAELGIVLLLFLVGLKLDLKLISTLGAVSLATGLGQVAFTSIIGFFIGLSLGFDTLNSFYIAVALTFSSTIIIVKLLSDKREVDSLHGRISIGFLIVQDIVVVVAMLLLSAFVGIGPKAEFAGGAYLKVAEAIGYAVAALAFAGVFIRYLAIPIVRRSARSPELLIIFAIAWASLLAALGTYLGFSKELGGLLAGISLASTPFREAIVSRLSSLRDFLLLFFFISLGSKLDFSLLGAQVIPALIFSGFVLIGNPLIVMAIMGFMGYRKRTGFLAGLTVAQISEFSLIFIAMGVKLGHVNQGSLGLVTLVGLITIALSVYMITYSHKLYSYLEPILGIFERKAPIGEEAKGIEIIEKAKSYDVIIFGLGHYGAALAEHLSRDDWKLLVVDFNPDEVRQWRKRGYDAIYGDACDQEFVSSLPLKDVKWVVSAMPYHDLGLTHEDPRLVLIDALRSQNYLGKIAISKQHPEEIPKLKEKGADLIVLPFHDAAERALERMKVLSEHAEISS